jgi:undecaprenyl-diphosphatase
VSDPAPDPPHHLSLGGEHDGPIPPPSRQRLVHRFDDAVDHCLDAVRGREPLDRVVYGITELGDFSLLWHLAGWSRALVDDRQVTPAVRLSAALAAESVIVNGLLKTLFKRERPVEQAPRPHRLRVPLTTSFPSGHASSATMAAMLLADTSRVPAAWAALAAVVAVSRIHVRIHHASDVIGGVAVGLALGLAARRIWPLPRA